MNKYPPNLYTVEICFGADLFFGKSFLNADLAGDALRDLIPRMNKSGGAISFIRLWHHNTIISSYAAKIEPKRMPPPPDSDGIRRIPEHGTKSRVPTVIRAAKQPALKPSMKI